MWVEGESIWFELVYLIAYLLSYKPTLDWFLLRNLYVEHKGGSVKTIISFKGPRVCPVFR